MSPISDFANQLLLEEKRRQPLPRVLVLVTLAATGTALLAAFLHWVYGYPTHATQIFVASATLPLTLLFLRSDQPAEYSGHYLAANIFLQSIFFAASPTIGCVALIALAAGGALLGGVHGHIWLTLIIARCIFVAYSEPGLDSAIATVAGVIASVVFFIVQASEQARDALRRQFSSRAQINTRQMAIMGEIVKAHFDAVLQVAGNDIFNVSRSIEKLLGYTPDQFIDQPLAYYLHPDEPDITLSLRPESPPIRQILRLRHADGHWAWVELYGAPGILGGNPNHCMVVLRNYDTEHKVSDQLNQAQRLESMGSMAAAVAHDFNNMLTVIMGIADDLPDEQTRTEIRRVTSNAATLTNKLLTFGHGQVRTSEIQDLSHIVQEQSALLRHSLDSRYVVVESYIEDPLLVRIELSQFEQVLMNLVNNAREAMPEGGELEISLQSVEIEPEQGLSSADPQLTYQREGHYALLEVQDSGVGIEPQTLTQVFDPFFSTKPDSTNSGLGLSSCYGIVSQYGGFIDIDSALNAGTSVKVYLPIAETRDHEPTLEVIDNEVSIMVIDDDPGVVRVVRNALTRAGYSVRGYTDANTAVEAFNPKSVSLVVSDVVMPSISGTELVRSLRTRAPQLPVLFISGFTNEQLDSWQNDQFTSYLAKPFRGEEVVRRVQQLLESTHSRQQMLL